MEVCMDDKRNKLSNSKNGRRRSPTVAATGGPAGMKGRASRGPGGSVPGRLAGVVKDQRARFYIMRRCVAMLVCWRD